jgi:hypothetical protein
VCTIPNVVDYVSSYHVQCPLLKYHFIYHIPYPECYPHIMVPIGNQYSSLVVEFLFLNLVNSTPCDHMGPYTKIMLGGSESEYQPFNYFLLVEYKYRSTL